MFNRKARNIKALEARLDHMKGVLIATNKSYEDTYRAFLDAQKETAKYRERYNRLYTNICEVLAGADDAAEMVATAAMAATMRR